MAYLQVAIGTTPAGAGKLVLLRLLTYAARASARGLRFVKGAAAGLIVLGRERAASCGRSSTA